MKQHGNKLFVLALLASITSLSVMADEIMVLLRPSTGVMQKGVIVGQKLWLVGEDGLRKPAADGQYPASDGKLIIVRGQVITTNSYDGPNARISGKTLPAGPVPNPGALKGFDPQPYPPAGVVAKPGAIKGFDPLTKW